MPHPYVPSLAVISVSANLHGSPPTIAIRMRMESFCVQRKWDKRQHRQLCHNTIPGIFWVNIYGERLISVEGTYIQPRQPCCLSFNGNGHHSTLKASAASD